MSRRVVVGGLLALTATLVTAGVLSVVFVRAQGGGEPAKVGVPSKALQGNQITHIPQGTPVAGLTLPVEYGSIRLLAPGSVPSPRQGVPSPPGLTAVRTEEHNGVSVDACDALGLSVHPGYLPNGWWLAGCAGETVVWDDGESTDVIYNAYYQREGYYPIGVSRELLVRGEVVDVVTDAQNFAWSLGTVAGGPAVIRYKAPGSDLNGPFEVYFVRGGTLTIVSGTGIEIDELLRIADSIS